jgi:hypothetical protein
MRIEGKTFHDFNTKVLSVRDRALSARRRAGICEEDILELIFHSESVPCYVFRVTAGGYSTQFQDVISMRQEFGRQGQNNDWNVFGGFDLGGALVPDLGARSVLEHSLISLVVISNQIKL